jgi:hypothetical protein
MKMPQVLLRPRSLVQLAATLAISPILLLGGNTQAQTDGDWNVDAAGNWNDPDNWTSTPEVPGGIGSTVGLNFNITGNRNITINTTPATVGILNIGDAEGTSAYTLQASGGGFLVFDNGDLGGNGQHLGQYPVGGFPGDHD